MVNSFIENHRQVNHVTFTRLLAEVDTLSPTQMDSLKYVGRQCPFSGGLAVYEARLSLLLAGQDTLDQVDGCMNVALDTNQIRAQQVVVVHRGEKSYFSVYPNPARERVTLDYYLPDGVSASARIFSLSGKQVYAGALAESGGAQVELDVRNWAAGVYVCQIQATDGQVVAQKLVIIN